MEANVVTIQWPFICYKCLFDPTCCILILFMGLKNCKNLIRLVSVHVIEVRSAPSNTSRALLFLTLPVELGKEKQLQAFLFDGSPMSLTMILSNGNILLMRMALSAFRLGITTIPADLGWQLWDVLSDFFPPPPPLLFTSPPGGLSIFSSNSSVCWEYFFKLRLEKRGGGSLGIWNLQM